MPLFTPPILGTRLGLKEDRLMDSETILDIMVILMDVKQHPMVMRKACQMFQAAATCKPCSRSHQRWVRLIEGDMLIVLVSSRFRLLTTDRPGRTSLMDQLSDHLANKYRIGDQEEVSCRYLAHLCLRMLG